MKSVSGSADELLGSEQCGWSKYYGAKRSPSLLHGTYARGALDVYRSSGWLPTVGVGNFCGECRDGSEALEDFSVDRRRNCIWFELDEVIRMLKYFVLTKGKKCERGTHLLLYSFI